MTGRLVRRMIFILMGAAVVLIGAAAAAWGFWQTGGSGSAAATTADLTAPTDVAATVAATSVNVSWSPPSTKPTDSSYALSYQVFRSGTAGAVCGATTPLTQT